MADQGNVHLKSHNSWRTSLLRFVNITNRAVDVVWFDYEGKGITYTLLHPTKCFDINTFVGHPWIVRDTNTKDPLMLLYGENISKVCWPLEFKSPHHSEPGDEAGEARAKSSHRRKIVFITLPVYSLKERCFQVLRQSGINQKASSKLSLPKSIEADYNAFLTHHAHNRLYHS